MRNTNGPLAFRAAACYHSGMGVRSRTRQKGRRRRKARGMLSGAFLLFLAVAAAVVWLAWSRREPPTLDDQVIEMIRENPAAEVLAPSPGDAPPARGAGPEVLQMSDPPAGKRSPSKTK